MNPNIEQILLAQAQQDAQSNPSLEGAVALGAGGGALIGGVLGTPVHAVGKGIGHLRGKNHMLKPGSRMAGGLLGMMAGGGLGAAAQQQTEQQAGAAGNLLAKIQAQGGMTVEDEKLLEIVLRDAYTQQGLLG